MQSSNKNDFSQKIEARLHAKSLWKDFMKTGSSVSALLNHLSAFISRLDPRSRIIAYLSLPDEINIMSVIEKFPYSVYMPRFDHSGNMTFVLFMKNGEKKIVLREGPFGIQMPEEGSEELILPLFNYDTVFVPCLGTDSRGCRLGRGGGYYDRWKSRLETANLVGIMPSSVTELNFPGENHDIILNRVITEKGIVEYI